MQILVPQWVLCCYSTGHVVNFLKGFISKRSIYPRLRTLNNIHKKLSTITLLYNSAVSWLSGLFISASGTVLHWSLKYWMQFQSAHVQMGVYESAGVYLGLPLYVWTHTNTQALWFSSTRCWRMAVLRPSVTLHIVFSFSWKGVNGYKNYSLTVYSLFSLCNFMADFFF